MVGKRVNQAYKVSLTIDEKSTENQRFHILQRRRCLCYRRRPQANSLCYRRGLLETDGAYATEGGHKLKVCATNM